MIGNGKWYHDGHGLIRTAAGHPLALVYGYDTDREKEAQDVVALVLAVPGMLEALKIAQTLIEADIVRDDAGCLTRIRAAIAAAEGSVTP